LPFELIGLQDHKY